MNMDEKDLARMNSVLRHTLRNFASGIKTAMSILSSECENFLPSRSMEYFPLIANECNRLDLITKRMNLIFDPVQLGGGEAAGAILEKLTAGVRKDFPTAAISLNVDDASLGIIVRGSDAILAALREAAVNAIEADVRKEALISCGQREGFVLFRVEDRGPGVPAGDIGNIFQAFFTTRSSHIGIGLTIARRMMEAVGGTASAYENAGGGFAIELAAPGADSSAIR